MRLNQPGFFHCSIVEDGARIHLEVELWGPLKMAENKWVGLLPGIFHVSPVIELHI